MNHIFSPTPDSPFWLRHFGWLSFAGATLAHVLALGLLYWSIRSRDEVVILRYNAYLGIDLLGIWWQLFLVPAVSYFFVLINLLLMLLLHQRGYPNLAFLLACGNWFLSGASIIVAFALSFINV